MNCKLNEGGKYKRTYNFYFIFYNSVGQSPYQIMSQVNETEPTWNILGDSFPKQYENNEVRNYYRAPRAVMWPG